MQYDPNEISKEKEEKPPTEMYSPKASPLDEKFKPLLWIFYGVVLVIVIGGRTSFNLGAIALAALAIGLTWGLTKMAQVNPEPREPLPLRPYYNTEQKPMGMGLPLTSPQSQGYKAGKHQIYPHALAAIRKAGKSLDPELPIPTDLGLLVYKSETERDIYRVRELPPDVVYIQPYVQLYLPPTMSTVNLRFEIKTAEQTLFSHTQDYSVEDLKVITPPTRLPISQEQNFDQMWELHISMGDLLLASHPIVWRSGAISVMVGALSSDGEVSEELQTFIDGDEIEPLSLDDLLTKQNR
jgi:hypothetical protein